MKNILFINPSYRGSYSGNKASIVNPIFPVLSLATLSAIAKESGYLTEVLDMSFEEYNLDLLDNKIKKFSPEFICFTVLTPAMNQVRDMSCHIKNLYPNITMIAGGPHVSALPKESLIESKLDIIVFGEGELTFSELLAKSPLASINGIAHRQGEKIIVNPPRTPISNLDDLPMPAWDKIDFTIYRGKTSKLYARKEPFVTAEFSRGCIYKCDFCASKQTMAFGYRKKSPRRCADEVKFMQKLGIKEFMLTDDIFTTDIKWAKEVCRELIRDKNKVIWTCTNGIRVESADQELFTLMKKAGCYRVAFGFESGNDEVLKSFGKGGKASLEKGVEAVKLARKAGLDTVGYFLIGLSSDTDQTILETINYAKKISTDMLKFGITIAFPGTKMFQNFYNMGLIKSFDWDEYHAYTNENLYSHETINVTNINEYMNLAYRKAIMLNPRFILHRLLYGIKTLSLFRDAFYFIKFFFLTATNKYDESNSYQYRNEWPIYNFKSLPPNFLEPQKAKSNSML